MIYKSWLTGNNSQSFFFKIVITILRLNFCSFMVNIDQYQSIKKIIWFIFVKGNSNDFEVNSPVNELLFLSVKLDNEKYV